MATWENINPAAMGAWNALSDSWGQPLSVTSAYRSPEHNARVGGAKHSQHMHGNAFDVDVSNMSREDRLRLIEQARQAGFRGIGVYDTSLHFDVGPERAWGPDYTRNSLPEWAGGAVGTPTGGQVAQSGGQAPTGQNALAGASPGFSDRLLRANALMSMMPQQQTRYDYRLSL